MNHVQYCGKFPWKEVLNLWKEEKELRKNLAIFKCLKTKAVLVISRDAGQK